MHILLAITILAITPPSEVTVSTLDGPIYLGTLVAWDTQGIQIQVEGEIEEIPIDQLIALRWDDQDSRVDKSLPYVKLIDGSQIQISTIQVADHVATIDLDSSESKLEIPTQCISVVQLLPEAAEAEALWNEIRKKQLASDVLVVRKQKGPTLKDTTLKVTTIDYLSGVVGDLTDSQLSFQWDGEKIPVKRSKIAALAYYHARQPTLAETICTISTTNGTTVFVAEVVFEEKNVRIVTPCGVRLKLPRKDIVSADYSIDKLVYLSDLEPISVQWTPIVGLPQTAQLIRSHGLPRFDRSFAGTNLSLNWPHPTSSGRVVEKTYPKGLVLRSRTEIVYRLPTGMRRFQAYAGIAPETSSQGNVDLRIICDDYDAWESTINGNTQPVAIDLDIRGTTILKIVVDYGKNLDWGDRLHFVEARVTK